MMKRTSKILSAKGIHKSFGTLNVLKGVDIDIHKSEILSIIGKSGTGKSTLLHILGTLDTADEGSLYMYDKDISKLTGRSLDRFRNEKIGFIFQFHHLLEEFTAIENVMIPALISGKSRTQAMDSALELLDILDLKPRASHKPSQMSGGEQQRVAVARALINNPVIILADEPSGNLDTSSSEELHRLIFRLRDELEQTFVIVTHNKELAKMSDRYLAMENGILN